MFLSKQNLFANFSKLSLFYTSYSSSPNFANKLILTKKLKQKIAYGLLAKFTTIFFNLLIQNIAKILKSILFVL